MKTQLWYKECGFNHNPFSIKPAIHNDRLVGNADVLDNLTASINDGSITLLHGEFGVGKTTFLRSVIGRFAGRKKVIYFSCNRLRGPLDVDRLLHERFGTLGRMLKLRSRNMILLLDEASYLNEGDIRRLWEYHADGYFRSIVLVAHDVGELRVPDECWKDLEDSTFELRPVGSSEATELARRRIGDSGLISDSMLAKVFERSQTPREFLKNCEDVCRVAVRHGHKRVMTKDIETALA